MQGKRMSRRGLMQTIDTDRIEEAIRTAEKRTSGEIRVAVSALFWGDVFRAAERAFERLGMHRTRERNGVLLFVVPARRRFVVLGDSGIHDKVGQPFWDEVSRAMAECFRRGDFTAGLVRAIEVVAEQLSTHFPYDSATDRNELPDTIDFGKS
jgi:uncharacterized membrane protein